MSYVYLQNELKLSVRRCREEIFSVFGAFAELLLTKNVRRLLLTKAPQTLPFFAHNTNHRLLLIIKS